MDFCWDLDDESGWLFLAPCTTRTVDLKHELQRVIEHEFKQPSGQYKLEMQLIHDLRNDSLCVNASDVRPHLEEVVMLKRYVHLVQKLMRLLPDDAVQFEWNETVFQSLKQEFTHALYQLASFYSLLALDCSDETEETLDKTGIYFQYAAGIVNRLGGEYRVLLAQAQEVYYMKSLRSELRDSVLVQLCVQIALFYREASSVNETYCLLKRIYYTALAYYHYSRTCHRNNKLHDEKAYLSEIVRLVDTNQTENSQYSKLLQDMESLKLQAVNALGALDESLVAGEIKDLPSAQLVKCLLPKDLIVTEVDVDDDDPLFPGLLSLDTVREIEEYQQQLDEFVRNELLVPMDNLDKEMDRERAAVDVEGKIAALHARTVPAVLEKCRDEILTLGSHSKLHELKEELEKLKFECRQELDFVWSLKVPESNPKNETIMKSFHIYEQYMKKSVEGDELIFTQIDELTPFLKVFDDYEQLWAYLPDKEYLKLNPALSDVVNEYELLKKAIEQFDKDKIAFVEHAKRKLAKIDMIELMKKEDNDVESVFKNEIVKFGKEVEQVEELENRYRDICRQYREVGMKLGTTTKDLKLNYKFKETVNVLKSTHTGFQETYQNLNQGVEFYRNLLDNITSKKNSLLL